MRILRTLFVCPALVLSASSLMSQVAPALVASDRSHHVQPCDKVPEGLGATDWTSIREAYEANRHAALAIDGGYQARNPEQQWLAHFDGRGITLQPDAGGWTWGLQLQSYGFANQERTISGAAPTSAAGQRVAYDWDDTLQEWYVSDVRGLEHGYTLHQRPAQSEDGPLMFTLAVRGELTAQVQADGRGASFVYGDGAAVLTYAGLAVFDADGRALAARFEPLAEGLLLTVDERGARYPVTIDPIAQQAYLKASNTNAQDQFGWSVSVSADTVAVGARNEASLATGVNGDQSSNSFPLAGAVYVFVRSGTTWSQQAYLKASNTDAHDAFGSSVSVSGDTIVVGAPNEDSNATGVNGDGSDDSESSAGAAYVFVRSGTSWSQQAYLKASNAESIDRFGQSVAISGDTVVVGADSEASNATGVNGNQGSNGLPSAGAAYVFVRSGTSWSQQAYLKASTVNAFDLFGGAVAVSGDTVVVGANQEDSNATGVNGNGNDNSAQSAGAAYVFVRSGTSWSQQAYLKASNTGQQDKFGSSVSVSGDTIVVGAPNEDSNATGVNGNGNDNSAQSAGAAYVFVRSGTSWSQQAYLKASNTELGDGFATSVAVAGDTVVVGAVSEDSSATGVNGNQADNSVELAGAAYLFTRNGTTWSQQSYLKAFNTGSDVFGRSVAVSGGTVVIGANSESSSATGVNGDPSDNSATGAGAVYIFDPNPHPWTNLGFGLAGPNGKPQLIGTGTLVGGTFVTTTVSNLLANNVATLVVGFSAINAPFKGGVWVPSLDLLIAGIPTGPNGLIDLPGTWPTGIPAGFEFYEQYWQKYPAGGPFTSSNAIKGTTP